jgi:hypothetical protein
MGENGWELVAVQQTWNTNGYSFNVSHWYVFKKPREELGE